MADVLDFGGRSHEGDAETSYDQIGASTSSLTPADTTGWVAQGRLDPGNVAFGSWLRDNALTQLATVHDPDVRRLHRDGQLGAGQAFPYSWSSGGEPYGAIEVRAEGCSIVLTFSVRRSQDDEWRSVVEQAIPIVWTRCHFGRSRPWFRCSAHSNGQLCGRRVAVVYGAGESFACRNCCRLAYASQREALRHRGLGKARKIRMRLGGSPNLLEDFPEKPKGMHQRTYDRLRRTSDIAEERLWSA